MGTACSTVKAIIPQGADNDSLIVILSVSLVKSLSNVTATQKGQKGFNGKFRGDVIFFFDEQERIYDIKLLEVCNITGSSDFLMTLSSTKSIAPFVAHTHQPNLGVSHKI